MKKVLGVMLGVLSAIGGFVDMGDLVANAATGARFQLNLAWVVVVGVIGIIIFAEMSGRVAAMCGRPVFDLVRERLGPRFGAANLLVGIGQSALGLATWPVDAGQRLDAGLRGVLYSLPELLFVNIRKGTTAWLDASDLADR